MVLSDVAQPSQKCHPGENNRLNQVRGSAAVTAERTTDKLTLYRHAEKLTVNLFEIYNIILICTFHKVKYLNLLGT